MISSRRVLLALAPAGIGLAQTSLSNDTSTNQQNRSNGSALEAEIQRVFADLPERKAFRIWAPASASAPAFEAKLNANQQLFCASANKGFILCERLRQLDSPDVADKIADNELQLDETVWSIGSPVFNPPNLSGLVSERTAMEAMVTHSDNTATDMILKQATAKAVRRFIAVIGSKNTAIPDSTRALAAYLLGAADYRKTSWEELLALLGNPFANPPLNGVQTFASSADDLVSFYSRALQGQFFRDPQTLRQFRRILLLGDITDLVQFPIGINVYGKAGYFDYPGQHARCIAGGAYFPDRWVYFASILNWDNEEADDPQTVAAYFQATRTSITLVQRALGG